MSLHQGNPYLQYAPVMQHYVPPQSPAQPPAPPPQQQQSQQTPTPAPATTVAPGDTYNIRTAQHMSTTTNQAQNQPQTQNQTQNQNQQSTPLVAQGDWTKNLVHLAKTAELKKHALTLQLHTAHLLSSHTQLETKNKALQDVKEEKNRLESERTRLLNCLRQVNEDRDKADLMESTIFKEISELRTKIQALTDGEYAAAKREVDALRAELGQPPTPSLQQTLEEKGHAYLNERRLNGAPATAESSISATSAAKRATGETTAGEAPVVKRPRGRPKGSKNKKNLTAAAASSSAGTTGAEATAE